MSDNDRTSLQALLDAVIRKLRYDDSYDFDNEGEEEQMFVDYRKELKVLFDNIASVVSTIIDWFSDYLKKIVKKNESIWIKIPYLTNL